MQWVKIFFLDIQVFGDKMAAEKYIFSVSRTSTWYITMVGNQSIIMGEYIYAVSPYCRSKICQSVNTGDFKYENCVFYKVSKLGYFKYAYSRWTNFLEINWHILN